MSRAVPAQILLLLLYCGMTNASAQQISLAGTVPALKSTIIHLTGARRLDVPIPVDSAGRFGIDLPNLPVDFYTLESVGDLYLRPGDSLTVDSAMRFTGKGAFEDNLLQQIRQLAYSHPLLGAQEEPKVADQLDPVAYLALLRQYEKETGQVLRRSAIPAFKDMAVRMLHAYCEQLLTSYKYSYGTDLAAQERLMALYQKLQTDPHLVVNMDSAQKAANPKSLSPDERHMLDSVLVADAHFEDSALLVHSASQRFIILCTISDAAQYAMMHDSSVLGMDINLISLRMAEKLLRRSSVRAYFTYLYTDRFLGQSPTDQSTKDSVYKTYMLAETDPIYKGSIEALYNKTNLYASHKTAPDFGYPDTSGKVITLHQLRGKYVYIDIWATWCGPCRAEIPHFKELTQAYAGKNIDFVGISIDRMADKQTWIDFVAKEKMAGIQVLADKEWGSEFVTDFGVGGIPRFILIDPEGHIVSPNEHWPSDPALRKELDGVLTSR